jgi:transcriptional regulator with XRE-family HTH domain
MIGMAIHNGASPSTHFGRQMKKERLAHGWTLREFSVRTGIDFSQASRIENGKQPPSEKVAQACDEVWPERNGWFTEYYQESKSWTSAGFRNWSELEDQAVRLRVWSPGVVDGLLQTERYARAMLGTAPGATAEMVAVRLAARMERQRRVLMREEPPTAWFAVDEMALYRRVGSAELMAEQMGHLAEVASMPNVTMQVMPAIEHPANPSELIVADEAAAYVEHLVGGLVYTDDQTVSSLARMMTTILSESYRASESLAMIKRMEATWTTGARAATATTGQPASKSRRPRA